MGLMEWEGKDMCCCRCLFLVKTSEGGHLGVCYQRLFGCWWLGFVRRHRHSRVLPWIFALSWGLKSFKWAGGALRQQKTESLKNTRAKEQRDVIQQKLENRACYEYIKKPYVYGLPSIGRKFVRCQKTKNMKIVQHDRNPLVHIIIPTIIIFKFFLF